MRLKIGRLIVVVVLSFVVIGFYSTSRIVFAKGETTSGSGWERYDNGNRSSAGVGLIIVQGSVFNGDIRYGPSGSGISDTEDATQIPIPKRGKLLSLAVNTFYNTLDADAEITVRLNGVDTALKITVPASSTSVQITTSNINMSAGDLVSLKIDATSAGTGAMNFNATMH